MTYSDTLKEFSDTLKSCGLTRAWASRKLEITSGYLTSVLNGDKKPSSELVQEIKELSVRLRKSGLMRAVS